MSLLAPPSPTPLAWLMVAASVAALVVMVTPALTGHTEGNARARLA